MTENPLPQEWWSADEPPSPDPLFRLSVMARIEDRRFRLTTRRWLLRFAAIILICWWLSPQLDLIVAGLDGPLILAACLTAAGVFVGKRLRSG